jgi:hypothetical protein
MPPNLVPILFGKLSLLKVGKEGRKEIYNRNDRISKDLLIFL